MRFHLAVLAVLANVAAAAGASEGIAWRTDFDAALLEARGALRPMLVDYTAPWCAPCRQLESEYWPHAAVQRMLQGFVAVKVDFDGNRKLARRHGVEALPRILFFDPWGERVAELRAIGHTDQVTAAIRAVPNDFAELAPWQERLARDAADVDALRASADFYSRHGLPLGSNSYLARALEVSLAHGAAPATAAIEAAMARNLALLGELRAAERLIEKAWKRSAKPEGGEVALVALLDGHLRGGDRRAAQRVLQRLERDFAGSAAAVEARGRLAATE